MITITAERIRSIIADCKTETQVSAALKAHRIKHKAAEGYSADITIPCKAGTIRIYRTCSRRSPFVVQSLPPARVAFAGIPAYRPPLTVPDCPRS